MAADLKKFLNENFKGLILNPALIYAWDTGIRFQISNPAIPYDSPIFIEEAHRRALTLFDEIIEPEDVILFVTKVLTQKNNPFLQKRPLNIYRKYIKHKSDLYKLRLEKLTDIGEGFGEEDSLVYRFVYAGKKGDILYPQLLKALCYQDFDHPSTILKNQQESGYDVYFINLTKKFIYHLYDDRGCDILAKNKEDIHFLYEKYNGWVLEYDREKIDAVFQKNAKEE